MAPEASEYSVGELNRRLRKFDLNKARELEIRDSTAPAWAGKPGAFAKVKSLMAKTLKGRKGLRALARIAGQTPESFLAYKDRFDLAQHMLTDKEVSELEGLNSQAVVRKRGKLDWDYMRLPEGKRQIFLELYYRRGSESFLPMSLGDASRLARIQLKWEGKAMPKSEKIAALKILARMQGEERDSRLSGKAARELLGIRR